MDKPQKISTPDLADNQKRLLFLAMFLLSLIYAAETANYFVDSQVAKYLGFIAKGLVVLLVADILLLVYWKIRFFPAKERYLLFSIDSYAMQVLNRACQTSWILTFVLLSLITTTTDMNSSSFPAEFYLNLTLFFMLAVFSISFFILFQMNDGDELEQNDNQ